MQRVVCTVFVIFFMGCAVSSLTAQSLPESVTNISFGSYSETHGDDRISGGALSISHKRFFTEKLAYFVGITNASASGTHDNEDGTSVDLQSERTSLQGGLKWHYMTESNPWLIPYVGGGLSLHSYSYDFEYENSEIGSTSGTGYGPLLMFGARMDIAKHFLIIPGYQYEQIYIESEAGEEIVLTSAGFMLALVIRF